LSESSSGGSFWGLKDSEDATNVQIKTLKLMKAEAGPDGLNLTGLEDWKQCASSALMSRPIILSFSQAFINGKGIERGKEMKGLGNLHGPEDTFSREQLDDIDQ
jgi:hypothetical protein